MVPAGKLNKYIFIDRETKVINGFGESIESWERYARTRAGVLSSSVSEVEISGAIMKVYRLAIVMRYRSDLSMSDSITFKNRRYEITSLENIDEANNNFVLGLESYES